MQTADSTVKMADALRKLVVLADTFEPEWAPDAVMANYRATVLEGRKALLNHDTPTEVAQVTVLPVGDQLALAA